MPLKALVHGEITGGRQSLELILLCLLDLQFQDLEETIFPTTGNPTLLGVPRQAGQLGIVGDSNLGRRREGGREGGGEGGSEGGGGGGEGGREGGREGRRGEVGRREGRREEVYSMYKAPMSSNT